MLRDLTQSDWLSILGISHDMIPHALLLRGTRNLKSQYAAYRDLFDDVVELGTPNGIVEDILIGSIGSMRIGYASVYGGSMASEIVHIFGVLGTPIVVQIGCCGAIADGIGAGDLVVASEAYCGDGASQYYKPDGKTVRATLDVSRLPILRSPPGIIDHHVGRIFTTAALFAESSSDIDEWHSQGFTAVDMETAATLAVAEHFQMRCASILFAFDNPRQSSHLLLEEVDKAQRRAEGNRRMNEAAFTLIQQSIASS